MRPGAGGDAPGAGGDPPAAEAVVPEEEDTAPAEAVIAPDALERQALVVRGLVKRFGDSVAVDRIDLTVPAGSFYGIVGPNGAGKTTTLSIIAGPPAPDAGTVQINGVDVRPIPSPRRSRSASCRTGCALSIGSPAGVAALLRSCSAGSSADVVEQARGRSGTAFDLTGALSRVVSDYSAGMTKKIMLAGAMIHSPRVLVLDEPFESVDPVSSAP